MPTVGFALSFWWVSSINVCAQIYGFKTFTYVRGGCQMSSSLLAHFSIFWRGLLTEPRLHCLSRLTGHRDLKILLTTSVVLGLQGHTTIWVFTWVLWIWTLFWWILALARDVAQLFILALISSTFYVICVAHTYNPITEEVEIEESEIQGHVQQRSESEACLWLHETPNQKIINFNSASYLVPKIHFFVAQPRIPVSGKLRYLKRIPTEYKYDVCIICLCGSQKVLLFRSCPAAIWGEISHWPTD